MRKPLSDREALEFEVLRLSVQNGARTPAESQRERYEKIKNLAHRKKTPLPDFVEKMLDKTVPHRYE